MEKEQVIRKLTAIFSADVAGYSRLMGDDETATIKTLSEYRELIHGLVIQHRGRVVDSPGDNILAEFSSVVDAVQSAVAIQKELKVRNSRLPENRRMEFRIGINIGDVVQEGDRIYGDGVNIAARLESLAEPGGICISRPAFDQIESKLPLGYEYMGKRIVKNMTKPLYVYRVVLEQEADFAKKKEPEDDESRGSTYGFSGERYKHSFREAKKQFKEDIGDIRRKIRHSRRKYREEPFEKSFHDIKDHLKEFAKEIKDDEQLAETFSEIKGRVRTLASDLSGSSEQRQKALNILFQSRQLKIFLGIACFLFLLNAITGFGRWWFQYPTVSIGLILHLHWLKATFLSPERIKAMRQRLLQREAERLEPELRESEEGAYQAVKNVEARLGFYKHLYVYMGVNAFLILINMFSNPFKWWFPFPLLGWGVIVFLHWLTLK